MVLFIFFGVDNSGMRNKRLFTVRRCALLFASSVFLVSPVLADPPITTNAPVSSSLKQGIQQIFSNQTPIVQNDTKSDLFQVELGSLSYADKEGVSLNQEDYKSKKVLVYFWSIYCRGCIQPMKELETVQSALKDSGIEVITVHLFESDKARLINRLAQMSLGLPVLFGANEIRDLFAVKVLPTALAFDDKHRIIARFDGGFDANGVSLKLTQSVENAASDNSETSSIESTK